MALIEYLESDDWKEVLRKNLDSALDVLKNDRFRTTSSSVDDLRSWLTAGGVGRVREHLNRQMEQRQFPPDKRAAINDFLEQLSERTDIGFWTWWRRAFFLHRSRSGSRLAVSRRSRSMSCGAESWRENGRSKTGCTPMGGRTRKSPRSIGSSMNGCCGEGSSNRRIPGRQFTSEVD